MTARLGNVLCWAFSGLAGISVLPVLLAAASGLNSSDATAFYLFGALFSISALFFWLIGRACHYASLAGDVPC
jgi:hypothetical protein